MKNQTCAQLHVDSNSLFEKNISVCQKENMIVLILSKVTKLIGKKHKIVVIIVDRL